MTTVIGLQSEPTFDRFKTFLEVLEVYGTGYQDEVWAYKQEEITHRDRVIRELRMIIRLYDLAILALERSKNQRDSIMHKQATVGGQMVNFFVFSRGVFENLINI